MRPADCKSVSDVLALQLSHELRGNFSIIIQHDGAVILMEQEEGRAPTHTITIPRRVFQSFIEWYQTDQ